MHCVCYMCAQKVVLGMEGCGTSSTGCVVHVVGVSLIAGMEYGMERWNGKWNGTVNIHSYS